MKSLTRSQMRRAAFALAHVAYGDKPSGWTWWSVADQFDVPREEIDGRSPRLKWLRQHFRQRYDGPGFIEAEASMLLSEANRPAGHDGGGE